MKRPLIAVALPYVGGILLGRWAAAPLTELFAAGFFFLIAALVWARMRGLLLYPLLLLAGWINLAQHDAILAPHDLQNIIRAADAPVVVRGVLQETPRHRMRMENRREIDSSSAQLLVTSVGINKESWQPATGLIATSTREILPNNFFAGQTVEIGGTLARPKGPVAEGLFDYPFYLDQLGIHYVLYAPTAEQWKIISSPARPPLADRFSTWAKKTIARGLPTVDETLRLEWALTLGQKETVTDEEFEPFIRAATYHIFAVDGLRIAIIAGILIGLLRVLGVPRAVCGLVAIPLLLFYVALTHWPASAVRALVMIVLVFGTWALKRPGDLLNSLFAAALIILVGEPRQLFLAGFQLSFFVVLCIVLILPFFEHLGRRALQTDPLLPDDLRPRWQKLALTPARHLLDLLVISLAAWLGSIPLVAYYFHLVTPVSGLANVFAVPLCGLVLICNLSSLLLAWLPCVSELFNHAAWFWMDSIRVTSQWSANWPGAYFYVATPEFFTIGLYYLILLTSLTGWLFAGKWRAGKIAGLSLVTLIWCVQWLEQRPAAQLTILPLQGGYAVDVQSAGRRNDWLVDCGNASSVNEVVTPFLHATGRNRLSHFILTHGEAGYSGGATLLADAFQPRNIYTSAVRFRSPSYTDFEAGMKVTPAWQTPLQCGSQIGPWVALHPAGADHFSKGEDNALVLRGEFQGIRILLLSDLGKPGQHALLAQTNDLRADIVVAGIPGDGEPLGDMLLDAIHPQAIIIADAERPATRRAKDSLKLRLAHRHIPVIYTSASDAVTVTIQAGRWNLRAMDGTLASGRAGNFAP